MQKKISKNINAKGPVNEHFYNPKNYILRFAIYMAFFNTNSEHSRAKVFSLYLIVFGKPMIVVLYSFIQEMFWKYSMEISLLIMAINLNSKRIIILKLNENFN